VSDETRESPAFPHATRVTRLAPSPTGALHLGNARTFLLTWAVARRAGWRIVLRVEDLDGPRVKPGAVESCVALLEWLGIDWDDGPIVQSHDLEPHVDAMRRLARAGLVYPCDLSRAEIEAAASAPHDEPSSAAHETAAPHPGGREARFPPDLRPPLIARDFDEHETNWRFAVPTGPPGVVRFHDAFAGPQSRSPADTIGDFVVWTKRAQPAYQLAVVVDDHRQGVTDIIRGDDLLDSAARQLLLYRALSLAPEPRYCHLPLVVGPDGRRLAKRHGDTRLDAYRARGVRPERVVGLLARWCGIDADEIDAREFGRRLDLATIPRSPVVMRPEDDVWLVNE